MVKITREKGPIKSKGKITISKQIQKPAQT